MKAPFDLKKFKDSIGIQEALGEKGYTNWKNRSIRPTLMSMEFGVAILEKVLKQSFPVRPMQKSPCVWFPIKIGRNQ